MENQTPNITPKTTTPTILPGAGVVAIDIPHHQLLKGLYFLLDAFDRAQIQFFLVRQTAKDVLSGHELTGDRLHVGVRNNEWINGNQEILFPYFEQEHTEVLSNLPNQIMLQWQDIPFVIHIYEDNECLLALTQHNYEYETWSIPNQFARFEKEFDK